MGYIVRAEINEDPDYDAYVRALFEMAGEAHRQERAADDADRPDGSPHEGERS